MAPVVLSPRDLAGCEHRVALDFSHDRRPGAETDPPGVQRRKEAAADHRAAVRELLRAVHSDQPGAFVIVDPGMTTADRVAATLGACDSGASWVWNATLPTDETHGRRGHAELLVRHGDGYVPVIVVNHRVTQPAKAVPDPASRPPTLVTSPFWTWAPSPDPYRTGRPNRRDNLRLAQLTAMLVEMGRASSTDRSGLRGGVIGVDADCIVVHDTGAMLDDYQQVLDHRLAVAAGEVETEPRRISECRSCPWWVKCGPELEARHDVSLVATGNQGAALMEAGITTIDQLAAQRGAPPEGWPGGVRFGDAVIGAIAWLTGTDLVRRLDSPRVHRADIEIDVDMESYGEHGAYLWGTLRTDTTDASVPVVYRPFVTWDPLPTRDEARSFAEFWGWLMAERAAAHDAGQTFAAYCYSQQAENRWLLGSADRFAGAPGIPSRAEVEAFIASPEWVDIYEAVGENFICPHGKGLKRVAPVAGFAWRDEDASGEASMEWYRAAVALGGGRADEEQRTRLLEYNEDDVRATKVLREWISDGAAEQVPHERDLLARQPAD
ncbi:TM0106 family RecB-like putative nuclease [Gordonia terrae]|uniref:TM0106 family RecB-like putative nuclease n=1 Tax=Gordonia terrae TaxID=2055 RepID=UPI003F6CC841